MFFGSKRLSSAIVILITCASTAFAQELRTDAIAFEVDTGTDAPVLVMAFAAQDTSPQINTGQTARDALIPDSNMPAPSIVLGRVGTGLEAQFGILRLLPSTVAEIGFAYDDLDARQALKTENEGLFQQLVNEGHVDPPENIIQAAVQTELARMNCYRSRVDNVWGPGSRRSVTEYFAQRPGVDWPEPEASVNLFRAIIAAPDVSCPTPVAQTRQPAPQPTQPQPQPSTAQQTPQPAPQPQPQPQQQSSGPQLSIGGSTGVFR